MIEAVVFDMDGVIVETEQYWVEEEVDILDAALPSGHGVTPEDITGINVDDQYNRLSENYDLQISREEYFDRFDETAERVYERADLMPRFHDLLDAIQSRGYLLGLCTSSYPRWIDIVFETHDLGEYFDVVVSAAELDGSGKPEPDIYEHVARKLGVEPEAMLVIEDSEPGVMAASRAGAYTIGYVADGDRSIERADADTTVFGPDELREVLLSHLDGGSETDG